MSDRMFLATATFTANDRYLGSIEFVAGKTRVAPGHEILERYPERFRAVEIAKGQPRCRDLVQVDRVRRDALVAVRLNTSIPLPPKSWEPSAARLTSAAPTVVLRSTRSPFVIRVAPAVHASLRRAASDFDTEVGGFLIGEHEAAGIRIETFSRTEAWDQRTRSSVTLGWERAQAMLAYHPPDRAIVGTWHTHPSGSPPSAHDRNIDAGWFGVLGGRANALLILAPDPGSHPWVVNPYVMRKDGGRTVVEPAGIEEGYSWE